MLVLSVFLASWALNPISLTLNLKLMVKTHLFTQFRSRLRVLCISGLAPYYDELIPCGGWPLLYEACSRPKRPPHAGRAFWPNVFDKRVRLNRLPLGRCQRHPQHNAVTALGVLAWTLGFRVFCWSTTPQPTYWVGWLWCGRPLLLTHPISTQTPTLLEFIFPKVVFLASRSQGSCFRGLVAKWPQGLSECSF